MLVGHDYGIHPVLGAADRRAERVARIVYLDAGMPQDGAPALAAVPDQCPARAVGRVCRGGRTGRAEGADGALPPPARDEWPRWGSTAGVPDAALDRLTALAAPQPLGTLLQPLRLTGAAAAVPVTGVLCTGNGASIEMVQMRVDFGDPALPALTDPRVTFFELPTGHWPMLSCPDELADVLLRAAAGEGHRLDCRRTPRSRPRTCGRSCWTCPSCPASGRATSTCTCPTPRAHGRRWYSCTADRCPPRPGRTPRDWPTLSGIRPVRGRRRAWWA